MSEKYAGRDLYTHIRNRLREIGRGRFSVEIKSKHPGLSGLSEVLSPTYFESCVSCTLVVAGYNAVENKFKVPSLAKRIGECLQKCAVIASKVTIISRDDSRKKDVADVIELMNVDWSMRVSWKALIQLKEGKYNNGSQLPDKDDVRKVVEYVDKNLPIHLENLKEDPSNAVHYNSLMKLTLSSVIILNRKRPGDTHRLKVSTYESAIQESTHDDIWTSLSVEEKHLVTSLKRVETPGKKKHNKIPIRFTPRMQDCVAQLLQSRRSCGVPSDYPYVFANVNSSTYCRGSDAIRKLREDACCTHPERVTATNMRKEAATVAKIAGLSEAQVEELAQFLGHDIRTHLDHYRLPEATLQTARVST